MAGYYGIIPGSGYNAIVTYVECILQEVSLRCRSL
jgi:hypothetical protein